MEKLAYLIGVRCALEKLGTPYGISITPIDSLENAQAVITLLKERLKKHEPKLHAFGRRGVSVSLLDDADRLKRTQQVLSKVHRRFEDPNEVAQLFHTQNNPTWNLSMI